ncbi:hypothetical protein ACI2OX_21195 [Bacillus sp. N9]
MATKILEEKEGKCMCTSMTWNTSSPFICARYKKYTRYSHSNCGLFGRNLGFAEFNSDHCIHQYGRYLFLLFLLIKKLTKPLAKLKAVMDMVSKGILVKQ